MTAPQETTRTPPSLRLGFEEIERLFASGPLGMLRLDTATRIVFANDAAREMIGLPGPMLLGSALPDLIPRDDRAVFEELRRHLLRGEDSHGQAECRLARLNDSPLHTMLTAFALSSVDSPDSGFVLIIQDITARKKAEEREQAAHEHWRALWVNVPDNILELDRDHRIVLWNHEDTVPAGEPVVGESFLKFTRPDMSGRVRDILEHAWLTGEISNYEVESRSKQGAKWWANRVVPVVEDGRVVRMLHIGSDITAVKRAERERARAHRRLEEVVEERTRELRTALEEKDVLLREVHHRVKNNLQIVSSLLRLQARRLGDTAVSQVFRESRRRVESMARIHEYLYRSDHFQRIDFRAYMRDLGLQLIQAYEREDCKVGLEFSGGNIDLSVDEAIPCGLIFSEAVSNSLKHAFPDRGTGAIAVTLERADAGCLTLRISDNGCGLPPGLNPGAADSLGLKLIHQLAGQLGGDLEISGSGGTVLQLTFPTGDGSRKGSP